MTSVAENGPIRVAELGERQQLKQLEGKILDLLMIMDATLDTTDALARAHQQLCSMGAMQHPHWSPINNDPISFALRVKRRDIYRTGAKLQALRPKVKSTTRLVSTILSISLRLKLSQQ